MLPIVKLPCFVEAVLPRFSLMVRQKRIIKHTDKNRYFCITSDTFSFFGIRGQGTKSAGVKRRQLPVNFDPRGESFLQRYALS